MFLLSWTPYAVVSFYVALGYANSLHPLASRSAAFFAKAEVIWNPIVYIVMVKDLRRQLCALCLCRPTERTNTNGASNIELCQTRASVRTTNTGNATTLLWTIILNMNAFRITQFDTFKEQWSVSREVLLYKTFRAVLHHFSSCGFSMSVVWKEIEDSISIKRLNMGPTEIHRRINLCLHK